MDQKHYAFIFIVSVISIVAILTILYIKYHNKSSDLKHENIESKSPDNEAIENEITIDFTQSEKDSEVTFNESNNDTENSVKNRFSCNSKQIPYEYTDTITGKMMGKAYMIKNNKPFTLTEKDYATISQNIMQNTTMYNLLRKSRIKNKEATKDDDNEKEKPKENEFSKSDLIRFNFDNIRVGCQSYEKLVNSIFFRVSGFNLVEDTMLSSKIAAYMSENDLTAPSHFFEQKSGRFILTPVILPVKNETIDKKTLYSFRIAQQKPVKFKYYDTKTEFFAKDIKQNQKLLSEITNFLTTCGHKREYYEDLHYYNKNK